MAKLEHTPSGLGTYCSTIHTRERATARLQGLQHAEQVVDERLFEVQLLLG